MLCTVLGGDPVFNNAVDKLYPLYNVGHTFRMMQSDPPFLRTATKLKGHGQYSSG